MDSTRPILHAELEFFNKGTGKGNLSRSTIPINNISTVPLVVVFTKFDGQIIQESGKLDDIEDDAVKWKKARENAEITSQRDYLPKVFGTKYPPKVYVCLEGEDHYISCHKPEIKLSITDMDIPENDCPELTEKTADAIDDASLRELFASTQMNNLDLCVKAGLE
jgi:hypothetical protein